MTTETTETTEITTEKIESIVVLNVGGYETYRSSLTAYPDTLLGTMFADRNSSLLKPIAGSNEYFIDRDGHLFRYVLQFYRTGTIHWPTPKESPSLSFTKSELYQELDFFQIPFPPPPSSSQPQSLIHTLPPKKIISFLHALRDVMHESIANYESTINFSFNRNEADKNDYWNNYVAKKPYVGIVRPFAWIAYSILERFGEDMGRWMKVLVPEITFRIEKHLPSGHDPRPYYRVTLSVQDDYDYDCELIRKKVDTDIGINRDN
ncbi:5199_t:CDS:2 [Ambispora gerdemannii]|uniref:5199_t:CDS:1 n=1 Tax=Ambispora gerdemannii TaxID=144530 RepID=A0A9N9CNT5_9GLOM|nr:5199_t:CDS:2 [Ambispora gerdemannii]